MISKRSRLLGSGLAFSLAASALAWGITPAASADESTPSSGLILSPYYTTGDLTGDDAIGADDLDLLIAALGTTDDDAGWSAVAPADFDEDGTISVTDLADLSQRVMYDDGTFDVVEADAAAMQKAMNAGVITSVELTQRYLDRIEAYDTSVVDTSTGGRALNAIIATGGVALAAAAQSDADRAANGGPSSMLDGIPILLKDNYDTKDMPTTAGCGCWTANQTADDATMVKGLRDSGAIILGKASLDEFAYGFASEFSALSPVGGTKLVASPYVTSRTAGGSSGGTGAAIAANLGAIGFGTDTGGSIRVPSSYNQLVGIRPTVGLTSRSGIVPLALSQDTGGPMARSVEDAAVALDAVVGTDTTDPATSGTDAHVPDSYTRALDPNALDGVRLGYLTSMTTTNNATANRLFAKAVADLEAQGATVVPITIDGIAPILAEGSGSTNEFKHDLNIYIQDHLAPAVTDRSLESIITSGHFVTSRSSIYTTRNGVTDETYANWMASHGAVIASGQQLVTGALDSNELSALIYPSTTTYGTFSTNLRLSPNTGMPTITVPMGQSTADDATVNGAGVNLEFLGRDYAESSLIGLAYSFEQATKHRTTPALYGDLTGDQIPGPGTDTDASGDGSVSVSGPTSAVKAGKTFTVTVKQNASDLYAYGLSVDYDPKAVKFERATAGTTGQTTASAKGGTVSLVHTKLGTSPGANGPTDLATLTFTALKSGPTAISAASVETVNSSRTSTSVADAGTARVTVTPVVTPPIKKVSTKTKVKVKPHSVRRGQKITATVTVRAKGTTPRGYVVIRAGGRTVVKRALLRQGTAKVSFRIAGIGRKVVTVRYVPTGNFLPSSDRTQVRIRR